jgi:uncharacterized protein with HEPN domain
MDLAAFEADSRTRDAVERCLERISEAASKLGAEAERLAPGPPWQAVRSFGNVLRHAYDQIDPARIWEIVTRDLPLSNLPSPRHCVAASKAKTTGQGRGYRLRRLGA